MTEPHPGAPALDLSIIICTRNRGSKLQGTLDSLAALRSDHTWEVIVADNASTDDTVQVVTRADRCGGRLRIIRVEQVGLGAARDAAWRQASGRIISFTDDDCYVAPDYVDQVIRVFDTYPDVGCVGGRIMLYDPQDARITIDERTVACVTPANAFVNAGTLHGANLSFPRSALAAIGGLDPYLGAGTPFPCEDIDAVAAVVWSGSPVMFHPGPVVWHHHRRRETDLAGLFAGYDRGRGAYYAKYVLRPDTRLIYARAWWGFALEYKDRNGLVRLTREIRAGLAYLRHMQAYGFLLAAIAIGTFGYAIVLAVVGWRILLRYARAVRPRGSQQRGENG